MAKSGGVISEDEFLALQSALLQTKQEKYEAVEKEQRASKELTKLKQLFTETDQQLKKANGMLRISLLNFQDTEVMQLYIFSKIDFACLLINRKIFSHNLYYVCI